MKKIITIIATLVIVLSLPIISFAGADRLDDQAGVLSESEKAEAVAALDSVSNKYGIDAVVVIVNDTEGKSDEDYADDYYDYNDYSFDGVLFLIDIPADHRWISTKGEGIQAFTDYGIQQAGAELKPLVQSEDYLGAITAFASYVDQYFTAERNGQPVDYYGGQEEKEPLTAMNVVLTIVVALVIGFLISLIITAGMKKKMTTVVAAANANDYVEGNRIDITDSRDRYLYHTVVAVPLAQNNNRSGGGSSTHTSSSGSTHGGGGF